MKVGFFGDTILSDTTLISNEVLAVLQSTAFNITNLEAPFISSTSTPRSGAGMHNLTHSVDLLKQLNVKAVSLANNHMMDFGDEGVLFTINHLKSQGIGCFGAGAQIIDAYKPYSIDYEGRSIHFYGAMQKYYSNKHFATHHSGGVAPFKYREFQKQVSHHQADLNVLFIHWNQEFEDYPEPVSKCFAENLVGHFNLVVGSHAHCIQGIAKVQNMPVVYSLGNFVLPHQKYYNTSLPPYPPKSYESIIFIWDSDNSVEPWQIIPISINKNGNQVELRSNPMDIIEKIATISKPLELDYTEYRKFYLKNRYSKKRPILSLNNANNRIIIGSYMLFENGFKKLEISIANILDLLKIRLLAKKALGIMFKRYR